MALVEVTLDDDVARVDLNHPPLNVLDLATARELADVLQDLAREPGLAALVLGGRGRAFSAGVDVRDHLPDRGAEMLREFHRACRLLLEAEPPVLAAVRGPALGGGCELTLACDLVVAAEGASFGFPEIRLGVFPPLAAVALAGFLPRHVAHELVLTGRTLQAAEAARLGLVNRVVAEGELDAAVESLLAGLRGLSRRSLRVAKQALRLARPRPDGDALEAAERLYLDRLLHDPDAIEGLKAFLEKRPPRWPGV